MTTIRPWIAGAALALAAAIGGPAEADTLQPAEHPDFSSYTFALTWQPVFCRTEQPCLASQPKDALIGLHGLWPSLPASLAASGVTAAQWWARGCDFYEHTDAVPTFDLDLQAKLDAVVPNLDPSLLAHEFDKHASCFKYDAATFFTTALAMHDAVASSSFGTFLLAHAGQSVPKSAVKAAFVEAFGARREAALQLMCTQPATATPALSEMWITVKASGIGVFPGGDSLISAPGTQENCPADFTLTAWAGAKPIGIGDLPNLTLEKSQIAEYYNDGGYAADVQNVISQAQRYIDTRVKDGAGKPALVLDIDDTSVLTIAYERAHDYTYDDVSWNAAVAAGFPAIPATLGLARHAEAEGVAVIFVTGRRESQTARTRTNLDGDGYPIDGLYLRPAADKSPTVEAYKTATRAAIEAQGYTILATIGDQYSDLIGGHAERAFKMPNPMYYLP